MKPNCVNAPAVIIAVILLVGCGGRNSSNSRPEITPSSSDDPTINQSSNISISGYRHTHIRGNEPIVKGSGVRAQESRDLDSFDSVEIATSADFKITRGEKPNIKIAGDDNIVPLVSTEVSDNSLIVSVPHSYATNNKLQMLITTPVVQRVAVKGSADGFLDSITDDSVDIRISGSGKLGGVGNVGEINVKIDGSGDVLLHRLHSKQSRVTVSGSGKAEVHATESLDATVNGSGDVRYSGAPKQVRPKVNGSGSIRPAK